MASTQTINASSFKAHCLEILDQIANHTLESVTITKRGQVVGILLPPTQEADKVHQLHGFMRGSVVIPADIDLTEPVVDETFTVEDGGLHA